MKKKTHLKLKKDTLTALSGAQLAGRRLAGASGLLTCGVTEFHTCSLKPSGHPTCQDK